MRILVLTSSYPRFRGDHAGHFVQAEVQSYLDEGHQVTVLRPGLAGAAVDSSEQVALGGSRLFGPPGAWPRLRNNPLRVAGLVSSCLRLWSWSHASKTTPKADRIVAHWLFPGAIPWVFLLQEQSVPLEVVIHGTDLRIFLRLPKAVQRLILHALSRRKASLRFVSQELKNELLTAAVLSPFHTWLCQTSVRPALLKISEIKSSDTARQELGLGAAQRIVLIIGRMIPEKRLATALVAATLIPGANIFVIGEGPLAAKFRSLFPTVSFLGTLPRYDTLSWIAAADLLVSASRTEGAPTTIREALTLGTTVVSPQISDLYEWSQTSSHLWLID